jgi:hypothetical protein
VDAHDWGSAGPPDELLEVPPPMRLLDPERNLKWQTIARYASQIDCRRRGDGTYAASCGYLRAFVKRHEFFWTRRVGGGDAPSASAVATTTTAGASPAGGTGAVLVVAAHPDDEALGAAGVIESARAAGRRVLVAVVTTGDSWLGPTSAAASAR